MNDREDYRLVNHTGKTIAMGTLDQMASWCKHEVPDGTYTIRCAAEGVEVSLVREGGIVSLDDTRPARGIDRLLAH